MCHLPAVGGRSGRVWSEAAQAAQARRAGAEGMLRASSGWGTSRAVLPVGMLADGPDPLRPGQREPCRLWTRCSAAQCRCWPFALSMQIIGRRARPRPAPPGSAICTEECFQWCAAPPRRTG